MGAIRRDLVIVLIFITNFYFIHLFEVILLRERLPDLGLSLWWGQLLFLLIFFIILLYTILVVLFLVNRSRLWGCLGLFSWLLNGSGLSFALLSSRRSFYFPKLAIAFREAQFGVLQGWECKSRIEKHTFNIAILLLKLLLLFILLIIVINLVLDIGVFISV